MTASIKDVAAYAAVSVGTVSNVLNGRAGVSPEVARRVHDAIAELGYVRNDAARQLRAGKSRSIGLVLPDIGNPFFAEVARGAERRAAEEGLAVLIVTSDGDASRETRLLGLLREQRVRGVLISPASDDLAALRALADAGTAVVLVDRHADDSPLPSVAVDDVAGGRIAAEHLLARGRRRIAFAGDPRSARQAADRLEGARRAVAERADATLEVIELPGMTVQHGRAAGEGLRARASHDRPDGVFAANDLLAVGMLQDFVAHGILVPEGIALIGYDDIDFAAATAVPLSSVRQPASALGYTAVDVLLAGDAAVAPAHVRFQPELIARASTTAR